ncbi:hypothetical protein CCMA1212_004294 [Trichoderma ghanense]|uniref:SH3 domain-containing protein n=1 Tax=Trichoderma ghanense TaxID=65468 RepID=A0ABY2H613_9HYPO
MPNSHRHFHRHRDILDDIENIINGVNPDDDSHQRQSPKVQANNVEREQSTVVQVVYKTMKPTFSGPIGGYVTIHSTPQAKETPKPEPTPSKKPEVKETPTPKESSKETPKPTPKETPKETPTPKESPKPTPTPSPSQEDKASKESSAVPSAISSPKHSPSGSDDDLAKATGSPTHVSSPTQVAVDGNRAHSPSASATLDSAAASSPSSVSDSGSGTSAGAKAGIALGVLGGVLVLGLLIFFLVSRRRKQAEREELSGDDEKAQVTPPPAAAAVHQQPVAVPEPRPVVARALTPEVSPAPSPEPVEPVEPVEEMVRTNPVAPRISLRPASQFGWDLENQAAKGAEAAAVGVALTGNAADRPDTSQSNNPANPFGQQAERVPSPVQDPPAARPTYKPYSPTVASVSDKAPTPEVSNAEETAVATAAVATTAAVVAAGAATLTRKTSIRNQNSKAPVDLTVTTNLDTVPPSPVGTDYSASSASPVTGAAPSPGAAAIAAAGGPANSTVHRVQLDFKPTLEDEMELKAGDLVRLLHEYDDGWALVIRLDRSRQGVVPRTCLSTRPVKPRPPQGRPPVPAAGGPPRGTNSPTGQRPMTPQGQRPMTPQGQRPMTPQGMRGANGTPNGAPRMGPGPGSRPASPAGPRMNANGSRPQSPMGRPMSPGPKFQGPPTSRPQSPSGMSQRASPPVSSPLNPNTSSPASSPTESPSGPSAGPIGRKPVPGQAY